MSGAAHGPASGSVRVGPIELAYLSWGDPAHPLVVLVHGFPDTAWSWDVVGPRLAEAGFRAVAVFTRGIAPSSIPADGRYDDTTLGQDVLGFIDALGAKDAIVVGHDWGAVAAYAAAALGPGKVRKLVTLAIPHPATVRPTPRKVWGVRHFLLHRLPGSTARFAQDDFHQVRVLYERWSPGFPWPDSEFAQVKTAYAAPGSLDAALGYYRAMTLRPSPWVRRRIAIPTLIVGGKTDGVADEVDFQRSASRFTGPVEVRMVPGGHFLHREHPDAFLDVLLPFVSA